VWSVVFMKKKMKTGVDIMEKHANVNSEDGWRQRLTSLLRQMLDDADDVIEVYEIRDKLTDLASGVSKDDYQRKWK